MAEANQRRAARGRKGGRVHQHEAVETFRPGDRRAHADRPAPIVGHQRDLAAGPAARSIAQVRHALGQAIGIRPGRRLVRQAAADVVGHDEAISPAQGRNNSRQ